MQFYVILRCFSAFWMLTVRYDSQNTSKFNWWNHVTYLHF